MEQRNLCKTVEEPSSMNTDASENGIGVVLFQILGERRTEQVNLCKDLLLLTLMQARMVLE